MDTHKCKKCKYYKEYREIRSNIPWKGSMDKPCLRCVHFNQNDEYVWNGLESDPEPRVRMLPYG